MMPDSFWECYRIFLDGGAGRIRALCRAFMTVWL